MPPDTKVGGKAAGGTIVIERIASRANIVTAASLVAAICLAWWWLAGLGEADGGMSAMARPVDVWTPAYLGAAFIMWALMMVAMMLPSASPMILLYGRFVRGSGAGGALVGTVAFALAYVAVWTLFSAAAAIAQAALVATGLLSAMALRIGDIRLAGMLLILAAIYEFGPLKRACLDSCRSPLSFLMGLWRPGAAGAWKMGLAHGGYCLGCCWVLMLLLFVGGVMNLAWIAGLGALVLFEKIAPRWMKATHVIGVSLAVAGALMIVGIARPV